MNKDTKSDVNGGRLSAYQTPEVLLCLMAAAVPLSFATWSALITNFSVERAGFTGDQFGLLQSLREVPGFLAFAVIFVLVVLKEQTLAVISLLILGVGTALTGFFSNALGLYCITVLMSLGYHYYETIQTSLSLQWIEKSKTPQLLGKLIAVGSFTSLIAYGLIYLCLKLFDLEYKMVFVFGGGLTILIAVIARYGFPYYPSKEIQHKKLILRKRYWLYYMITFFAGARRQIFVVFAGFLMVEKFEYAASTLTILFLINCAINIWLAPLFGKFVHAYGEKKALVLEYTGLIIVFTGYAITESAMIAAILYVVDHVFFGLSLAIKSYFQKIADPADIASTAGVAFTINHIAAVILPVVLGLVWLTSPPTVFLCGTALAVCSLFISFLIPENPQPGNETVLTTAN